MKKLYSILTFAIIFTLELSALCEVKRIRNQFIPPSSDYVMVVAHRGDFHSAQENSTQAVINAYNLGAFITDYRPAAFEVILKNEISTVNDAIKSIKRGRNNYLD